MLKIYIHNFKSESVFDIDHLLSTSIRPIISN